MFFLTLMTFAWLLFLPLESPDEILKKILKQKKFCNMRGQTAKSKRSKAWSGMKWGLGRFGLQRHVRTSPLYTFFHWWEAATVVFRSDTSLFKFIIQLFSFGLQPDWVFSKKASFLGPHSHQRSHSKSLSHLYQQWCQVTGSSIIQAILWLFSSM